MRVHDIEIPDEAIADFCRRHGVKRLALFGSILTDDFRPDSDIDILVEFHPNVRYSLLDLGGMWAELREMIGREIDLKTPLDLSRYFRAEVVSRARSLYAA
jgi:predicted nucleotidyltransferase